MGLVAVNNFYSLAAPEVTALPTGFVSVDDNLTRRNIKNFTPLQLHCSGSA